MIEGLQRQLAGFSFQESSNVHHASNLYPSVSSQPQKPISVPSQDFYGSNASAPYSSTAQHLVPPPQHVQPQNTTPIAGYERTNQVGYQSTTNPVAGYQSTNSAGYQSTNSAGYHQTVPPSQAPYYPPPPGLNQPALPPTYYSAPAGLNQATPPPSYYSAPPPSSNNFNYRQPPQLPVLPQSHPGWQASQTAYYNGPSVPMNPQAPLPPPPSQHAPPGHYYQPPPSNYYR